MVKKDPRANLRPFKPGQSGNPSGRPKGTLTADEVSAIMGKFCRLTRTELQAIVQDPKSTMIQIAVASILARAAKDGDYSRLEFLLTRSIGKVKDQVEMTTIDYDKIKEEVPIDNVVSYLKDRSTA